VRFTVSARAPSSLVRHVMPRPENLRDALSNKDEGMDVASVSYVEDAGHMVCSIQFCLPRLMIDHCAIR